MGFGFGYVIFEMRVRNLNGVIEEVAGYIYLGFRRYIYIYMYVLELFVYRWILKIWDR